MNDNDLLDEIKAGYGLRTEAQLAAWLGMSASAVYRIRKERGRLSLMQRLVVLDKIGFLQGRKLVEAISPDYISIALKRLSVEAANRAANRRIERAGCTNDPLGPDAQILNLILTAEPSLNENDLVNIVDAENIARINEIMLDGNALTTEERINIVSNLSELNEKKWVFPTSSLTSYLKSSNYLLDRMLMIVFPSESGFPNQANLLDAYKQHFRIDSDIDLAKKLEISPQQISHARTGVAPLSVKARLKMSSDIDALSGKENPMDYKQILRVTDSPEDMSRQLAAHLLGS